ncbi:DUF3137 domain-containing protein [Flammeovirga aprica]|uniref:DUF3137 domain-containing protein n=1 Tax=Flammeovirga aprica JL-4 TaxID=694437 RepID=A0A7X9S0L3_9BACT|nr:DUF3137 domain-containing protein [Flammeovirga aprica]NME72242.1 DUF3137 domain-containing protein [Flammeovirga aprica JL-4]
MITKEELNLFYKEKLESQLDELEKHRKLLRNARAVGIGGGVAFAINLIVFLAVTFIFQHISFLHMNIFMVFFILGSTCFGISHFFGLIGTRGLQKNYKDKVVTPLVKIIDDTWIYKPKSKITQNQYTKSLLYSHSVDHYEGDDLIEGVIEHTDFKCSELHTQYITGSGDKRTLNTIFKGLFFHADFNKHFSGVTFVRSKGLSLPLNNDLEVVRLENELFTKLFYVRSTDQIEARYILTPTIMEAFVNLYNYYQKPIDVSFVGTRVYCAVSFTEDLFEPPIYKSMYDMETIEKVCSLLYFNKVVIHELNLNTRIWTKVPGEPV